MGEIEFISEPSIIPHELTEEVAVNSMQIFTETRLTRATVDKLLRASGTRKFTEGCRDSIRNIINLELYHIIRTSLRIKKKTVLTASDITNALCIMGFNYPKQLV